MVIDTQDVDMSLLGADMMPWDLEYLPHDMLYFGDGGFGNGGFAGGINWLDMVSYVKIDWRWRFGSLCACSQLA